MIFHNECIYAYEQNIVFILSVHYADIIVYIKKKILINNENYIKNKNIYIINYLLY